LPRLKILSLDLDTYGSGDNAAVLRDVIEELENGRPALHETATAADFVVNGTFRVRRRQVADLLRLACDGRANHWHRIVEYVEPTAFHFRADPILVSLHVDYPLNQGGSLGIRSSEPGSDVFRLNLESISSGLNAMATECPRHFADFLNERADAITGDAFHQCCLFGELIY
jgi:hypothetical protein